VLVVSPDFVDGYDVRMVELCSGPGFAQKLLLFFGR
jgi:hypothetical protein